MSLRIRKGGGKRVKRPSPPSMPPRVPPWDKPPSGAIDPLIFGAIIIAFVLVGWLQIAKIT